MLGGFGLGWLFGFLFWCLLVVFVEWSGLGWLVWSSFRVVGGLL
jgi:hypothetical protein